MDEGCGCLILLAIVLAALGFGGYKFYEWSQDNKPEISETVDFAKCKAKFCEEGMCPVWDDEEKKCYMVPKQYFEQLNKKKK